MPIDAASRARAPYRGQAIYTVAILVVCLPYVVSFTSQLCSDDFVLLHYYGRQPLWALGKFFSPRTIWTYHPLQHYYYAVGWHLSGIEPWSYRAMSVVLHLATALVLFKFARDLTGSIHFGGCSAIAFAGQWRHWEAVAWAGSIATVQSTFFAILACTAFWRFLEGRRVGSYAVMILAGVGWFFSKETIVQLPLFLAVIYFYHCWREREEAESEGQETEGKKSEARGEGSKVGRTVGRDLALLLAVPVVLVIAYLIFHVFFVQNTYTFAQLGYEIGPVTTWPSRAMKWLDRTLNPFVDNAVTDQLGLRKAVWWIAWYNLVSCATILLVLFFAFVHRRALLFALQMALVVMVSYDHFGFAQPDDRPLLFVLSVVLAGGVLFYVDFWLAPLIGVRQRMLPLMALAMTLAALVPYVALRYSYFSFRYHYGVTLCSALLVVAVGGELWRLTKGKRKGWASRLRISVAAIGGLWVVVSFFQLLYCTEDDKRANGPARELYDFFASQTDKANRSALFVVDAHPVDGTPHVELGWGLLECARLALESDTVAAVELGFDLDWRNLLELNRYREKYLVRRKKESWYAARLPEGSRLVMTPNGAGGVALELE